MAILQITFKEYTSKRGEKNYILPQLCLDEEHLLLQYVSNALYWLSRREYTAKSQSKHLILAMTKSNFR